MNENNEKLYMRDFSPSMAKNIINHFSENYDARIDNELFPLVAIMGLHQNINPDAYWRKYHNATLVSPGKISFETVIDKFEFFLTFG